MTFAKKMSVALLAVLCILCYAGGIMFTFAFAEETTPTDNKINGYYGVQLTDPTEIAFYKALDELDFTKGDDSIVVSCDGLETLAFAYTQGDSTILKKFGAARDCYYYDNMDLFYVNFDYLTLGVALKNGNYVVSIGAGRADTYFVRGITAQSVQEKIDEYNNAVDEFETQIKNAIAKKEAGWAPGEKADARDIAVVINDEICKHITYGFCDDGKGNDTVNSPFIRTTYGALVIGECVCEGYARLYKLMCNRFDIACELIYGDYVYSNGGVEPHMWTAVKIDDEWLACDPTFNDSLNNSYLLVSGSYIEADHFANPVISTSEHEMGYPELAGKEIKMPSNLFEAYYYVPSGSSDIYLAVGYMGMGAKKLADTEGLYIAYRVEYDGDVWSPWNSLVSASVVYDSMGIVHYDTFSTFYVGANRKVKNYEFAIFNKVDDAGLLGISGYYNQYSDKAVAENMLEKTNTFANDNYDSYYVAPPYIKSVTYSVDGKPSGVNNFQTSMQDLGHEYSVKVKYTQNLVKKDPTKDVTVSLSVSFPTKDAREDKITEQNVLDNTLLTDVNWNENTQELTFKVTPSPLFQHNRLFYTFQVENLVNVVSSNMQTPVAPNPIRVLFGYTDTYICTKCLGGGRYLIDNAYAQPALVDDSDLSTQGWEYEGSDGKTHKVSESQRSNIALVVNTPTGEVAQNINDNLSNIVEKTGAKKYAAQTYEVDLQICGAIVTIPNGSYLKIKLGYPAGYDYSNIAEGTTFKLYHFKRNKDGSLNYSTPEEIECVFTEYGIIALVESFSPYTLVALEVTTQTNTARSVTTQFNGIGGVVSNNLNKPVVSLANGETVTYTLNPYTGYEIEYALLNGSPVAVVDGAIQIAYDDLPNKLAANTLSIGYVAKSVKEAEKADTESVDLSLAYVANTVSVGAVQISDSSSAADVLTAVSGALDAVSDNITGEAETVEQPILKPADGSDDPTGGDQPNNQPDPDDGKEDTEPKKKTWVLVVVAVVFTLVTAFIATLLKRHRDAE